MFVAVVEDEAGAGAVLVVRVAALVEVDVEVEGGFFVEEEDFLDFFFLVFLMIFLISEKGFRMGVGKGGLKGR